MRSRLPLVAVLALGACAATQRPWSVDRADPASERHVTGGEIVGGPGRDGSQAWLGLPFAAPPVGPLRWRAPGPPVPWTGTRETLDFGSACPQFATPLAGVPGRTGEVVGSEDCLYLNVWTPTFAPAQVPRGKDRLPVMVWIHGGGNSIGTAAFYDGGHLAAAEHVVVVTLQYRLGPLGWLRHRSLRAEAADPLEASGNFGTLDLVQALRWVRDNAAAFGGDPGNVTIFGESAGGMNVYSLLLSPPAKGLFQRAIVESGGLSHTTPADAENLDDDAVPGHKGSSSETLLRLLMHDRLAADRAAAKAKLAAMSDAQVAAYLRGKGPRELIETYPGNRQIGMLDMPLVFRDGAVLAADEWIDRLARADGWNQVPVLVGTNRDEAKLFLFLAPYRVRRYFGIVPRFVDEPSYQGAADALSRMWKAEGADGPASAMRGSGERDVYVYRFDWRGEPKVLGADLASMLGAAHGLEVPFVFGHFDLGRLGNILYSRASEPSRLALSTAMMRAWASFARDGSPGRPAGVAWTPWDDAPGAPKSMLLDVPGAGGLRMSPATESVARVLEDVTRDARLPTERDRCRVFHGMVGHIYGLSRSDYAGKLGCADFAFDAYPW